MHSCTGACIYTQENLILHKPVNARKISGVCYSRLNLLLRLPSNRKKSKVGTESLNKRIWHLHIGILKMRSWCETRLMCKQKKALPLLKDCVKTAHRRVEFYCEKKMLWQKCLKWGFSVSELKKVPLFSYDIQRGERKSGNKRCIEIERVGWKVKEFHRQQWWWEGKWGFG